MHVSQYRRLTPSAHRTRIRQNGSRERGFGTLQHERLFIDEIDNAVMLAERAEEYRIEYHTTRPTEAITWRAWPT